MAELVITETIAAPPALVFDLFTDLRGSADLISGIQSVEVLTDGPVGVGTRFRETRIMFGKEATEEMEVVAFEPGRSWTVAAESCGSAFRTQMHFHAENGGTRVEMVTTTKALTLFAKLMSVLSFLMIGAMKKALAGDLADLKAAAEKRAAE